jgi:hypothetical protein
MHHWSVEHRAFAVETFLGLKCKATERRRAEHWGLRWNARDTRRTFSGVRTVRGRPEGFLLTMDAVVLNCVTQFNIVWRIWTFPFLPMSKCSQKTVCVTVAEPLFLKNVSTANARCSSDQWCMMTEGIEHTTQRCVFHCATYTDVSMALNLNRLMVSAAPCISGFLSWTQKTLRF